MISGPTVGILACYISKLPANCRRSVPKRTLQIHFFHLEQEATKGKTSESSQGGQNALKYFFCKLLNSYFGPKCIGGGEVDVYSA